MKKLRLTEVKWLVQGYTARRWQDQNLNPVSRIWIQALHYVFLPMVILVLVCLGLFGFGTKNSTSWEPLQSQATQDGWSPYFWLSNTAFQGQLFFSRAIITSPCVPFSSLITNKIEGLWKWPCQALAIEVKWIIYGENLWRGQNRSQGKYFQVNDK